MPPCADILLCVLVRGEDELFKAGLLAGCWIVFIAVDGRLWYCGKMCSHGNWKLFSPEQELKMKVCFAHGPLLQLFHPALRCHYVWVILIWMQGFFSIRRRKDKLGSLSCEYAVGNQSFVGTGGLATELYLQCSCKACSWYVPVWLFRLWSNNSTNVLFELGIFALWPLST